MKTFIISIFVAGVACGFAPQVHAIVSVTAATGGTNLSADRAQNGTVPAFTALGNIVIAENANGDFADTGGTSKTLILTAPSGWRFNAGVGTVTFVASRNISAATISVSSTTITVSITVNGGNKTDTLTISAIQVQATDGGNVPGAGNILRIAANPGTATIAGINNDTTNFGSLSQAVGALRLYAVLPGQTFVDGTSLEASGISGTALAQTAGTPFNITRLVAADRQFNIDVAYAGAKTISYTGPAGAPSYTTAVSFSGGQSTTTLATTLTKAETTTITATDGSVTGVTSSSVTVGAGAFVKLQLLVPGETAMPGLGSGKTGAPLTQTAGVGFDVLVKAVDANWNLIDTVSDTVRISSSDSGAMLPADAALAAGTNVFAVTLNTAGNQTLTATDVSSGSIGTSTSPSISVNRISTTTTVSSSLNPSIYGQAVTFTAIVTQVSGTITPTGTVTFKNGALILGAETLDGSGRAAFVILPLPGGILPISAVYSGDGIYNTSTSATLTQTVDKANTTTVVESSPNPSAVGQAVTLTATVTAVEPGFGTPTGTVTFKNGASSLGSGTLFDGQTTLIVSSLAAGTHTNISATYNSDANFTASISAAITQTVTQADTTTTLASSANPSVFGQAVVLTATINPAPPGTGTVTFSIDGAPQAPVGVNASGQAMLTNSSLRVGSHTIGATYSGDGNLSGSTATNLAQTVNRAATTSAITSSLNPSAFGQSVTFTGTVSVVSPGAGTRTGTLTFNVDGADQAPVSVNAAGLGTLVVSGLSIGGHAVVVTYGGDANFAGSTSATFTQTISKANSTTTVSRAPNPSVFGQSITFTATVSGSGTPTGTVTFHDAGALIGTGTLTGNQATFATAALAAGNHAISAVYGGDDNFNTSTSTVITQTVDKANTTTALSSSVDPVCGGQPVTFTATVNSVAPGAGTPTGTVSFRDGAMTLGSSALGSGQAMFTTASLLPGIHSITAIYSGSGSFNVSTNSPALSQTVNGPACSISGPASVCVNSTGNTYSAPAGIAAYGWSISGNGTITGAADGPSVSVNAGASGSFTLSVALTDTNGCTSSCATTVNLSLAPQVTANPTNRTACAGSAVSFSTSASGSPVPTVRWQASSDGGMTFTNIAGATSSTYTFTASLSQNGNQYRAMFTNYCGSAVTTAATLTVNPVAVATITADSVICANSTGNVASVPDAGVGATYSWTIGGGTITAGAGTRSITYTATSSSHVSLSVTVTLSGCSATGSKTVSIGSTSRSIEAWRNKSPLQWQSSTFNAGDHQYSDGHTIPYRISLKQLCGGSGWCIVVQYDFKDNNTNRRFYDFLTTYNDSENSVLGQECGSDGCNGTPTTYPIPADPELTYQLPGVFTVYNGTITNVSVYTTVSGSTIRKQLTISGTTDPGNAVKDVLILFGGHLARENEWGTGNGAHSFPGASAKMLYKFCPESSFGNFSVNPSGLISQADLAVTKTGAPNPVCPGGLLTYSVIVSNLGPNQATSVTVSDALPRQTSLVSATPPFTGTTNLTFALGAINAGSKTNITIVVNVSPTATGALTNTATVTAVSPADPFGSNNTATAITNLRTPPSCLISGPSAVCPASSTNFTGPAGMTVYGWSITGNGSIDGATNAASVRVNAGVAGSFTLGLSVTDTNGCSTTSACQKTVTVQNTGAPLLMCPEDRQLQCGDSTDPSNTGTATATGECGGGNATVTFTDIATPANCTGRAGIDRVWTATNAGGQSSVCTQRIMFADITLPLISCPADRAVNTDAGSCTASNINLGMPVVSDNCSGVTVTNDAPAAFPTGTNLVIWTATDLCGNTAICTQTVTVVDHQAPTISCPADIVTNTDFSGCPVEGLDLGVPVTVDNCGVTSLTNNAPAVFPVGTTLVLWTASDASGNQSICTQQVTITRDQPVNCYIVRGYDPFNSFTGCVPETGTGERLWSGRVTFNGDQWDTQNERTSFLGTGGMQMDQDVTLFYEGCLRRLTLYYTEPENQTYENILWMGRETGVGTDIYDKMDGCAAVPQVFLDPCAPDPCAVVTVNFTNQLSIACTEMVSYCGSASNSCSDCIFSTTELQPANLGLTASGCITGMVGCATAGSYTNIITIDCGGALTNINLVIELSCPQDPSVFAGLDIVSPAIESATLGWQPSNVSGASYAVYQATASGAQNFNMPLLTTTNLTAFVVPLDPGTYSPITYFFVVRAIDACGIADSNTVERSVQPMLDPNKDQDGDGMSNGFEEQFGLNPFDPADAASDSDGDGMSNLEESLAGTDPTNPASSFAITNIVREGSDIRVTWTTGIGRTNTLQCTAVAASSFTNNFSDIFTVNTTSTTTNYLDRGAATNAPAFYYRIRLVP